MLLEILGVDTFLASVTHSKQEADRFGSHRPLSHLYLHTLYLLLRSVVLNRVLIAMATQSVKLSRFNLIQANYKHVGSHGIRADFLVPKTAPPGKRPVILRFHGGGLVILSPTLPDHCSGY